MLFSGEFVEFQQRAETREKKKRKESHKTMDYLLIAVNNAAWLESERKNKKKDDFVGIRESFYRRMNEW